jgi:hypothetical protein
MKKLLLAATALTLLTAIPARADVILEFKAGGTGDNVVFNSLAGSLALATLNGQHNEFVQFRDLTSSSTFAAAANGNDIKITGTNNLFIQVYDPTDSFVIGTTAQVFSLKGSGNVTAFVGASLNGVDEGVTPFDLGAIDPNAQSFYTFRAVNGEVMTSLRLLETTAGGSITEFEHYRIDVAPLAVPGPMVGAGLPGLMSALGGLWFLNRKRRNKRDGFDAAMA